MSMFNRNSGAPATSSAAGPVSAQNDEPVRQPAGSVTNIIGKGTIIKGDLETSSDLRLDGKVKGHLRCTGTLSLSSGAVIDGDLVAQKAEISGEVLGNVEVTELLTLKPTANIKGDIFASKLVIEVGAVFNGTCNMGGAAKQISLDKQASGK